MQHEIKTTISLLDANGNLTQPGYAKKLLPVYDRTKVKGGFARLKEWDYYYVGNENFGIALTIADNSYMGLDSISFLSFGEKPWEITKSPMRIFPMGKTGLPESSASGVSAISGKGYSLEFRVEGGKRHLKAHMDNFKDSKAIDVDVVLSKEPEESIVIMTPFKKEGHFYYNQKINCMRASGRVKLGDEVFTFEPDSAFGVLDWGRGVWTYHNTWYWGSASGLADGIDFGFNIGYGFGDTSAASENLLIYDGKAHKLEGIQFNIPEDSYVKPWTFTSTDGRFEMDFLPVLDRAARTYAVILETDQHQVFGKFTGKAVLDDGTVLELRDFMGFAEKVHNRY